METYNFKKRNLTASPHLFGLIGVAAGIFIIISPSFLASGSSVEKTIVVGVMALVIGLIIVTSYGGTLIDFGTKGVKEYFVFCGYRTGRWEPLPPIEKVKVVATSFRSTNTPNGISPTLSGKVTEYKVLLYSDNPTPTFSFIYTKEDEAKTKAQQIAKGLDVELEVG